MASTSVSLLRRAARPILAGLYGGALSVPARQHLTSSCSPSAVAGAAAATGAVTAGIRNAMAGFHSSACPAADLSQSSGPSVAEETVSLVQASDKGIGLAFVEQLLKRQPTGRVIATCRDPMGAQHLDALHDQSGGRLDVMQLDVTKEDTIEAVAAAVRQKYGKLDLLLNTTPLSSSHSSPLPSLLSHLIPPGCSSSGEAEVRQAGPAAQRGGCAAPPQRATAGEQSALAVPGRHAAGLPSQRHGAHARAQAHDAAAGDGRPHQPQPPLLRSGQHELSHRIHF
ncbi:unnamed protein product [Closterium sp. NIES-53]